MRRESGSVVFSKAELLAFGGFVSRDVFRPRLNCIQFNVGHVLTTDGHRLLVYECPELVDKGMVHWESLARAVAFMRKGEELRLTLRKVRPVAMVGKTVFPLSYETGDTVPYKQVIPEKGNFARHCFNPRLLESLSLVAKSLGMLTTRVTLEGSSELGPLLFSFPGHPKWSAVVMGCRE